MRIYRTIKEATEEVFRAGRTNEEVLAFVRETFPHSSMTLDGIRTYRYNLRQIDDNVPTQREARGMRPAAGMKTGKAGMLATSYAGLVHDRFATKDDVASLRTDMEALEHRLNARIAYAQVATVAVLAGVIGLFAFLAP